MYTIKTPYRYINEAGAVEKAGEYLSEAGKNPLIIAGKHASKAVGEVFFKSLKSAGINGENLFIFEGFPSQRQFDSYAAKAKDLKADFIIGIGGGRVLDTAKAAGDIAGIPVATVPTVAATCASWAALTVQYDDSGAFVLHRQNRNSPYIVLADPKVIFTAPRRYLFSGVVDTFAKFFESRPTVERHPDDTPSGIALYESKIAYDNLEASIFKAVDEAEKGIYGKAAEDVIDAVVYLAGLAGSVKSRYGHYSFAHPFYHTSTQVLKSNIKLHGEKVAFGIVVQLVLEGRTESEILDAIALFAKYNADFVTSDFNLDDSDLRFLSRRIREIFPYAEWESDEVFAAFHKANVLTRKFRVEKSGASSRFEVKPRNSLASIPPYRAARSIESLKREYGLDSIIKLAANENTLGFSQNVWGEIRKRVTSQYPDGSAHELRSRIAEKLGIGLDNIVMGNGSFELIYLAAIAFVGGGDETIAGIPTFGWYKTVTEIQGGKFVGVPVRNFRIDLDAVANAVTPRTRIIWLCNPNNPTGTIFTAQELSSFLRKIPSSILVVLDEAYIDFVEEDDFPDSLSVVKNHANVVLFRTFSKLEGLANFRVGYAIGNRDFISLITKIKIPSNVSGAAQAAALASLGDEDFMRRTVDNAREQKKVYYSFFEKLGLDYVKSNTNFIFFDTGREAKPVVDELLRNGILVRDGAEYGFPTMIRVSIGSPVENAAVISALGKILGQDVLKEAV